MDQSGEFDFYKEYMEENEYILWKGKPEKGFLADDMVPVMAVCGAGCIVVGLLCAYFLFSSSQMDAGAVLLCAFFCLVGFIFMIAQPLGKSSERKRMRYVITNKRILMKDGKEVFSFSGENLPPMEIFSNRNGNSTLSFGKVLYDRDDGKTLTRSCILENLADAERARDALRALRRETAGRAGRNHAKNTELEEIRKSEKDLSERYTGTTEPGAAQVQKGLPETDGRMFEKETEQGICSGRVIQICGRIMQWAGVALFAMFFVMLFGFLNLSFFCFLILGPVLAFAGLFITSRGKKKMKQQISDPVVRSLLGQPGSGSGTEDLAALEAPAAYHSVSSRMFKQVTYNPKGHIPDAVILRTYMNFPFTFNTIKGSDDIQAKYRDLRFEMSDVQLETHASDANGSMSYDLDFKGQWFICRFDRIFPADLYLSVKRKDNRKKKTVSELEEILSGEPAFDAHFRVLADDSRAAGSMMNPAAAQHIIRLEELGRGDIYMNISRQGIVHLAIESGRDFFERNGRMADRETLYREYASELDDVAQLLDEMLLMEQAM